MTSNQLLPTMRRLLLLVNCGVPMLLNCAVALAEANPETIPLTGPLIAATSQGSQKLRLSSRQEGINSYLPGANHVISIRVPEVALQQGWRCCWIEAFSRDTASALSAQYRKPVSGNDAELIFDAARAESSLRQVAPGIFEARLALGSTRRTGSQVARIYVHLYRHDSSAEPSPYDGQYSSPQALSGRGSTGRDRYRFARDFLEEPVLTVRFMYAPANGQHGQGQGQPNVPPSQLPSYSPPR